MKNITKKVLFFIFIFLIIVVMYYYFNKKNNKEEVVNNRVNNEVIKKDLFSDYYDDAEELMKSMTIEEKVGQMFLAEYVESKAIDEIKEHNPGGYILYGINFEEETLITIVEDLQKIQDASKIKLILGVDEEGGRITRVSKYKAFRDSVFLSMQQLYEIGGLHAILEDSKEKSGFLKKLGLNMNLVPVVDISKDKDSYIYDRTYGKGAGETALFARKITETMNASNMLSVMKHFPGYGDNIDTHTGIAVDNREYDTLKKKDLLPFKSGIKSGIPCVLVSHNIVKCIDEEKPASLSGKVIKILREELNFSGIIMTDDLSMGAIKAYANNGEVAVQAVLAGNDIIISSDFIEQKDEILLAIKDGRISVDIINTAVRRILSLKLAYGII